MQARYRLKLANFVLSNLGFFIPAFKVKTVGWNVINKMGRKIYRYSQPLLRTLEFAGFISEKSQGFLGPAVHRTRGLFRRCPSRIYGPCSSIWSSRILFRRGPEDSWALQYTELAVFSGRPRGFWPYSSIRSSRFYYAGKPRILSSI